MSIRRTIFVFEFLFLVKELIFMSVAEKKMLLFPVAKILPFSCMEKE